MSQRAKKKAAKKGLEHVMLDSIDNVQQVKEQEQEHIIEDSKKFRIGVRAAFQIASVQMAALCFMGLVYYNYVMIEGYTTPFFWALIFSVLLRKLKNQMLILLFPLRSIEKRNSAFLECTQAKAKYLWIELFRAPFAICCLLAISGKSFCLTFSIGCWIPWGFMPIVCAILLFLFTLIASTCSCDALEYVISIIVVAIFAIGFCILVSLFAIKAVTETRDFAVKVQPAVQDIIEDPKWNEYAKELGVHPEMLPGYVATLRDYATDWLDQEGYNSTLISETVTQFAANSQYLKKFYDSRNSGDDSSINPIDTIYTNNQTFSQSEVEAIEQAGEEENSYFQILYGILSEIGFSEIYQQSSQFIQSWNAVIFQTSASLFKALNVVTYTFMGLINHILNLLIFFGALMYLVSCEEDAIETVFKLVPVIPEKQNEISERIKRNISQVFIVSLILSLFRGIITWFYFSVMNLEFAYCAAFLSSLSAIFPVSPWFLYIPALLTSYLQNDPYWLYYGIGIALSEFFVVVQINGRIERIVPDSSPYLTGMGLIFGVGAFGVKGVLIGPLLILLLKTTFELFVENVSSPHVLTARQIQSAQNFASVTDAK